MSYAQAHAGGNLESPLIADEAAMALSFNLPQQAYSSSLSAKDAKATVLEGSQEAYLAAQQLDSAIELPVANAEPPVCVDVTYWDIAKQFSILAWTAFGGPAAHVGLFEKLLVGRLRWMSEAVFMELFTVASCLPGPTSSQVAFAVGTVRKGVAGGLLSGTMFQLPGAVIMTVVGIGAAKVLSDPSPWLRSLTAGVSAVGVAMIASAAKGLLMRLCDTKLLSSVATLAAAASIYWNPPWLFPVVILVGGLVTLWANRQANKSTTEISNDGIKSLGLGMVAGGVVIAVWLLVLISVVVLVRTLPYDHRINDKMLDWFEVFYRTGSLIYGGGQVVLPMLLSDLVVTTCEEGRTPACQWDPERSWMTADQFFAGLGIVQAMPGPLFNFSAYLGAIIAYNAGQFFLLGTVTAYIGLFAPGVMLIFATLPYWKRFREFHLYRRALPGMNAASVGLILASVFRMTVSLYTISPFPNTSLCIALLAFTAVDQLKVFEPFVVLVGLALGVVGWAANMK